MNLRRQFRSRRGLSLIEVLLAFAVFMMAFASISTLITIGHDHALDAAHQHTATRLAQSKMAEIEAGIISPAETSGDFTWQEVGYKGAEAPGTPTGWKWELLADVPTNNPYLYEVTVRVTNQNNNRVQVALTQFVYEPSQMGNSGAAQPPTTDTTGTGTGQ